MGVEIHTIVKIHLEGTAAEVWESLQPYLGALGAAAGAQTRIDPQTKEDYVRYVMQMAMNNVRPSPPPPVLQPVLSYLSDDTHENDTEYGHIWKAIRAGRHIHGIKALRFSLKIGLREAKEMYDSVVRP
jgi:hypothetical protein